MYILYSSNIYLKNFLLADFTLFSELPLPPHEIMPLSIDSLPKKVLKIS